MGREEFASRRGRSCRIDTETAAPVGLGALQRMMHQVTAHHRMLPAGLYMDADMAGCMARRRQQDERAVAEIIRLGMAVAGVPRPTGPNFG